MFEFQDHLIFPTHAVPSASALPKGSVQVQAKSADGHALHGVHVPPSKRNANATTLILGFGGNAWNGADVASFLHQIYPGAHIVAFHYRGYAPSRGLPSAKALLVDAPLVYDAAVKLVQPKRTVAVGFSIGSGVAAQLAATRPLDGLILVTPFDSLKAVAQSLYPWLPIGPLFQHEMDAAKALERTPVPVAIIAAEHDQIVPSARTRALRKRAPSTVLDRTIAGVGHNDIYSRADFHAAMHEALSAVSK